MTARIIFTCPCCDRATEYVLKAATARAIRHHIDGKPDGASPALPKTRGVCKCGHEKSWHDGNGCHYGKNTPTGGCTCTHYHTRKLKEPAPTPPEAKPTNGAGALPKGERRVLTVIAQHGTASRTLIGTVTGYTERTRNQYLQELAATGLVSQLPSGDFQLTEDGDEVLGAFEKLPTGDALRAYWVNRLPQGESLVLQCVAHAWPQAMTREQVSTSTGYTERTRNQYIQELVKRRLIEKVGSNVRVVPALFDKALS